MKKLALICTAAACAAMAAGCTTDGTAYRADVYAANQVNQQQAVDTVEILALTPCRVAVDNTANQRTGATVGAVVGALAGFALGNISDNHYNHSGPGPWRGHSHAGGVVGGVGGAAIGGAIGSAASGSQAIVDGVQITYRFRDQVYNTAVVAKMCEYRLGTAILVQPDPSAARIQPNNPDGCPKEEQQQ